MSLSWRKQSTFEEQGKETVMDRRSFLMTGAAVAAGSTSTGLFNNVAEASPPLRGKFAGGQFEYLDSPMPAPNLTFKDANRYDVSISDFRGRIIVATVWATWCGVCKQEMPTINRAARVWPSSQVVFMPISIDAKHSKIQHYYDARGLSNLKTYHDPDRSSLSYFGAQGTPTTFIIDKQGNFRGRYEGPAGWDTPEANALLTYFVKNT
jgi:thiol-disulfide isomerase/thioredoxin